MARRVVVRVASTVRRVAQMIARWRRRENAVRELARLDDRALADIGLHRSEIRSAVVEADRGGRRERLRCR